MVEFGFLTIWFLLVLIALAVGFASHYTNAFLGAYPEKNIDGYRWRDHALNEGLNSNYVWFGHYDEDGWWEFYSLRNFTLHAALPVAAAVAFGPVFWSDRVQVVGKTCRGFAEVGMAPMFCL